MLEFRETLVFTREITSLLSEEEYAGLQGVLVLKPDLGKVVPGTSGLRKLRWTQESRGKGKRGGVRIIYYWYASGELIYMLVAYSKGERDDLTTAQKRALSQHVMEEFK
jgi:hypothetical protein